MNMAVEGQSIPHVDLKFRTKHSTVMEEPPQTQSAGTQIDSEIGQSRNNSNNNQLTVRAVQHCSDQM